MICNHEIAPDNETAEHIIPSAIGGRRKIRGFICRKPCNNKSGETWDAELAKQLLPLSQLFKIVRDRGNVPALNVVTTVGERVTIRAEGPMSPSAPTFQQKTGPNGQIEYQMTARSIKEARAMLTGLKRKHLHIDVESALANAKMEEKYLEGYVPHDLQFGGEMSGRSIIKTCLAACYCAGIDWAACQDAMQYIRNPDDPACFGYYYEKDLIVNRDTTSPLHCVHVQANPENGLIIGYAEYYGIQRIVACLGKQYRGPKRKYTYALDPRDGEEIRSHFEEFIFNEDDIENIYDYKCIPDGAVAQAASAVISDAIERNEAAEQDRVISAAVDYAFKNCGAREGEFLTPDHVRKLTSLMGEKLTPFLLHRLQRTRRRKPAIGIKTLNK